MNFSVKTILSMVLVVTLFACKKSDSDTLNLPVVQVDRRVLTMDELSAAIPNNLSKDDSTLYANDFIKRWVKSKLLLQRAELNLSPEEKDVDKLLDEYRSSLLIYKYEAKMVEQKYSSSVSDTEIQDYYNLVPDNFKLWEPIIKGVFVKIDKTNPNIHLVESKYRSLRSSDLTELEGLCFQNSKKYMVFTDSWQSLSSVLQNFPTAILNIEDVLRIDKYYTTSDSEFRYFFAINDVRWKGEIAPLESVKERIKAILVNKTRLEFIKKTETELYDDGVLSGTVKFFQN